MRIERLVHLLNKNQHLTNAISCEPSRKNYVSRERLYVSSGRFYHYFHVVCQERDMMTIYYSPTKSKLPTRSRFLSV